MARLAPPEGEPMQGQGFKGRMDGAAKEETVRGVFAKTRPIQLAVFDETSIKGSGPLCREPLEHRGTVIS